jgi:hypothetical protein
MGDISAKEVSVERALETNGIIVPSRRTEETIVVW